MPFADTDQVFAFAFIPVLAIVLHYGWHRIQRNRREADGAARQPTR
jgi:hypothetical protein